MKQLPMDDALRARLKAVAPDVDPEKIAVFKAAAFSTAPIRKKHPVYLGAVASQTFLEDMRTELARESRPLQIMHGASDGDQLPIGRVFDGEISVGTGIDGATELHTLFWIDAEHLDITNKVNSGTIDQVSVAILSKDAISNKTGFDFMGPNVEVENIWLGIDDKGNKMGHDGAHVIMNRLDSWFEMSLVGQGGAQGAKILGGKLHLSASNQDVNPLVLQLTSGGSDPAPQPPAPGSKKDMFDMDAKEFANLISEGATKLANAEAAKATAEARVAELTAQLATVTAERDTLKGSDQAVKLTSAEAKVVELTAALGTAQALPKQLLTPIFVALGQTTFELDPDAAKAAGQVQTAVDGLKALGARLSGGMSHGHHGGAAPLAASNSAFKRRA